MAQVQDMSGYFTDEDCRAIHEEAMGVVKAGLDRGLTIETACGLSIGILWRWMAEAVGKEKARSGLVSLLQVIDDADDEPKLH